MKNMKLKQKPAMIVIMFEKSYLEEKRQKHGAVIDFFATVGYFVSTFGK